MVAKSELLEKMISKNTPLVMGERYIRFYGIYNDGNKAKYPDFVKIKDITHVTYSASYNDKGDKLIECSKIHTKDSIHKCFDSTDKIMSLLSAIPEKV